MKFILYLSNIYGNLKLRNLNMKSRNPELKFRNIKFRSEKIKILKIIHFRIVGTVYQVLDFEDLIPVINILLKSEQ